MSRVLLISPKWNFPIKKEMYPSGGLLSIGGYLKSKGHQVKVVHQETDNPNIDKLVEDFNPNIVGITVTTFQTKAVMDLLVNFPGLEPLIVLGGPHVSALKEKYIESLPWGLGVVGEGEEALLKLAEGERFEDIPGLIWRQDGVLISNPLPELADVNKFPPTDLDLIKYSKFKGAYPLGRQPSIFIMGSRGCPFKCTFCSKSVYGNTVRLKDPELLLDEIEILYYKYGIREIFFQDDTLNLNRDWLESLLDRLMRLRVYIDDLSFRAPMRVNEELVDFPLLKRMKSAGFHLIFYGVESGNQNMLNLMKKGTSIPEIRRAFKLTHQAEIKTEASFIMGLPGENKKTLMDSLDLWKDLNPYWTGFSRATPFPGTAFYEEVRDKISIPFTEFKPNMFYTKQEPGVESLALKIDQLMKEEKIKRLAFRPWEAIRYI